MEVFCEIIVKKHGIYDIIKDTGEMKKERNTHANKKCSLNVEDAEKI